MHSWPPSPQDSVSSSAGSQDVVIKTHDLGCDPHVTDNPVHDLSLPLPLLSVFTLGWSQCIFHNPVLCRTLPSYTCELHPALLLRPTQAQLFLWSPFLNPTFVVTPATFIFPRSTRACFVQECLWFLTHMGTIPLTSASHWKPAGTKKKGLGMTQKFAGILNLATTFQAFWISNIVEKKWKFNFRKLKNQHFIFWPSILKLRIRLRIIFLNKGFVLMGSSL